MSCRAGAWLDDVACWHWDKWGVYGDLVMMLGSEIGNPLNPLNGIGALGGRLQPSLVILGPSLVILAGN